MRIANGIPTATDIANPAPTSINVYLLCLNNVSQSVNIRSIISKGEGSVYAGISRMTSANCQITASEINVSKTATIPVIRFFMFTAPPCAFSYFSVI